MATRRSRSWPSSQHTTRERRRRHSADLNNEPWKTQGIYRSLVIGEIRLLKLYAGSRDEPLHAELETVVPSAAPSYQAISYCWGKIGASETLYISRQPVLITKSLFGALRRFRNQDRSVYLWADAVCINQKDKLEKSVQISAMSLIYEQAEEVLVWLGEHHPQDAKAFWTMSWLAGFGWDNFDHETDRVNLESQLQLLRKHFPDRIEFGSSCQCCGTEFSWKSETSAEKLVEGLDAVRHVLDLPWFTRLWVVQENAVARQAKFHLGQHWIFWTDLNIAIQVAHEQARARLKRESRFNRAHEITELVTRYRTFKASDGPQRGASSLLDMLMRTAHLECERTEDRLYSIRAVAFIEDESSLDPVIGRPTDELWRRVAAYLVLNPSPWDFSTERQTVCSSFVLTMAGLQRRNCDKLRNLPSWAPDMTSIDDEVYRKYEFVWWNSRNNSAGGINRRFWAEVDVESWILYVRGGSISKIERMAINTHYRPVAYDGIDGWDISPYYKYEHHLVPWYLRCFHFAYGRVKTSKADPEWYDFCTLLSHGCVSSNLEWRAEYLSSAKKHRERYLPFLRDLLDTIEPEHDEATRPVGLNAEAMYEDLLLQTYGSNSRFHLDSSRVLAWTSDGRVGWVPQNAREGDLVVLMEGAPEPYVIRESTEDVGLYILIGDAYIHGIMYGEVWMYAHDMSDRVFGIK